MGFCLLPEIIKRAICQTWYAASTSMGVGEEV